MSTTYAMMTTLGERPLFLGTASDAEEAAEMLATHPAIGGSASTILAHTAPAVMALQDAVRRCKMNDAAPSFQFWLGRRFITMQAL